MLSIGQINQGHKADAWRLLTTGLHNGAKNMAIDEAIVEACSKGLVPPTIRFYGWQPAALSLGYFQHAAQEVNFAACQERGIDVVRRLTGGRAVLHDKELTYSIIVSENYPGMPMTITASYRYLSQGLLLGLGKLGVKAAMTKPVAAYGQRGKQPDSAACFDAPSYYELTVEQRKLIGSAQVRKYGVILQHGSILLDFAAADLTALLNLPYERQVKVQQMLETRVISLRQALGRPVSASELEPALLEGLQEALQIKLVQGSLSAAEELRSQELEQDKYSQSTWTKKR